jgi:hypothetical protein
LNSFSKLGNRLKDDILFLINMRMKEKTNSRGSNEEE